MAHEANFSQNEKVCFMLFPLILHTLDIFASTIGVLFVYTKPGLPEYDANYGELEDPLDVMRRGYRIAMIVGNFKEF